ncbi:recombinase family protein [Streptomyces sp. CAI-85]|uniref:recombinase family protein n=1 Tax=Streptomyces sp. CAI-85 TaxID=1472662 RepID=UPI00158709D4|nr:recombinase family protein [Streptomyces sp. CAI-85]NUV64310.1 recombinase family protein [Streptomyces sp. CAI-85]
MDLGYARVSTTAQDLTRQLDRLAAEGIPPERIYVDKRTGANMQREGLDALLDYARPGDRINVLTLDRLGRNMREVLNLAHDLTERGITFRTLGDSLPVDTSNPGPGTDMAIAMLAMFAQMERTYMLERAAGARAAKEARGLPQGRPSKLTAAQRGRLLVAWEHRVPETRPEEIAADYGVSRATLYREIARAREEREVAQIGAAEVELVLADNGDDSVPGQLGVPLDDDQAKKGGQ